MEFRKVGIVQSMINTKNIYIKKNNKNLKLTFSPEARRNVRKATKQEWSDQAAPKCYRRRWF